MLQPKVNLDIVDVVKKSVVETKNFTIKKISIDKRDNFYFKFVDESGNITTLSFQNKDFETFLDALSRSIDGKNVENLEMDWFILHTPAIDEIGLLNVHKILSNDESIKIMFDWTYYGRDKNNTEELKFIEDFAKSKAVVDLEATLKDIEIKASKNPAFNIDDELKKYEESIKKTSSISVNLDPKQFDSLQFAKKILGYEDFGKYLVAENRTNLHLMLVMSMEIARMIHGTLSSLKKDR